MGDILHHKEVIVLPVKQTLDALILWTDEALCPQRPPGGIV